MLRRREITKKVSDEEASPTTESSYIAQILSINPHIHHLSIVYVDGSEAYYYSDNRDPNFGLGSGAVTS
jgi:hypothetical protein